MLTRKTQYAWMALGGLICLFGLVLASKLRDGNKAIAQPEPSPAPKVKNASEWGNPTLMDKDPSEPVPPSKTSLGLKMSEPEKMLPPKKDPIKGNDKPLPKPLSEPKATLEMPFPGLSGSRPSSMSLPPPQGTTILPPSSIQPASFGPNTPTPSPSTDKPKATPKISANLPSKSKETDKSALSPALPMTGSIIATDVGLPVSSPQSTILNKSDETRSPSWNAPAPASAVSAAPSGEHEIARSQPGEPPLAPNPGPVQFYHAHGSETLRDIARRTLGSGERAADLHKLNPAIKMDEPLSSGATVRLPADACVQADEAETVKPLPVLHAKPTPAKAKALPLTGTYQCSLDEKGQLTLPRALRDQLSGSDTVLVSPGPDKCLWLTNQPHLERLGERLDQSHANEADVRVFKRLYFAQTEKLPVNDEGRVAIPDRLGQFAGLHQEVVLVGIDDHFEVWDAARWRSYTQQKSSTRAAADGE